MRGVTARDIVCAVETTLADHPVCSMSVALVRDPAMAELHDRFMGPSGPTEVLAFALRDDLSVEAIDGEVVVSVDTARRQAAERSVAASDELLRYVIHGTLHLMGYDDQDAAGRAAMRRAENAALSRLRRHRQRGGRPVMSKRRSRQRA